VSEATALDLRALWQLAWSTQQASYTTHCHGIDHWVRVERNGLWLTSQLDGEVDVLVVRLFAAFHDSQRRHDGGDRDHGPRAAEFILQLGLPLEAARMERLATAIRTHTSGPASEDLTIQVCHDADRLDLGRVYTKPDARFLYTTAAKELARRDAVEELDSWILDVTCPELLNETPRWDRRWKA
jgi:uncharacterized protein